MKSALSSALQRAITRV